VTLDQNKLANRRVNLHGKHPSLEPSRIGKAQAYPVAGFYSRAAAPSRRFTGRVLQRCLQVGELTLLGRVGLHEPFGSTTVSCPHIRPIENTGRRPACTGVPYTYKPIIQISFIAIFGPTVIRIGDVASFRRCKDQHIWRTVSTVLVILHVSHRHLMEC
jgi:hypothetical protein